MTYTYFLTKRVHFTESNLKNVMSECILVLEHGCNRVDNKSQWLFAPSLSFACETRIVQKHCNLMSLLLWIWPQSLNLAVYITETYERWAISKYPSSSTIPDSSLQVHWEPIWLRRILHSRYEYVKNNRTDVHNSLMKNDLLAIQSNSLTAALAFQRLYLHLSPIACIFPFNMF